MRLILLLRIKHSARYSLVSVIDGKINPVTTNISVGRFTLSTME